MIKNVASVAWLCLLSACVLTSEPEPASPDFKTQIRWTSYGIPHVKADDWAGLGYGFAYATATDAVCVIARDLVMVNGERARYFGTNDRNIASDVFHNSVLSAEKIRRFTENQSPRAATFSRGYVAGYNRYLNDHAQTLPASCAGEAWLQPMAGDDGL